MPLDMKTGVAEESKYVKSGQTISTLSIHMYQNWSTSENPEDSWTESIMTEIMSRVM